MQNNKNFHHDAESEIFQKSWREASKDKNHLTEKGLKNIANLSKKYSYELIFEAIKIAWSADWVDDDQKFRYMCGVLKNLKNV